MYHTLRILAVYKYSSIALGVAMQRYPHASMPLQKTICQIWGKLGCVIGRAAFFRSYSGWTVEKKETANAPHHPAKSNRNLEIQQKDLKLL